MKIAIINPSMKLGGSERVIAELSNFLINEGHKITIITTDREEKSFFKLDSRINQICILRNLSKSKLFSPIRRIKALFRLRISILNEKPNMVLSFQEKNSIYVLLSLIGKKVFTVIAIRNHPAYKHLAFPFSLLRKLLYKRADQIVVQTNDIGIWFKKQLNLDSIVIPNPINIEGESGHKFKEKTIYACGRLVPQKGFSGLLEIFAELKEASEWKLRLLGDGIERESLSQRARELGIEEKVIFEGSVKNPVDYYSLGGVFAFTSEYEGFPNALCEAMASGMAVVSFDCPSGPSDLIQDGVNGFLVKAGDKESFQVKLEKLLKDEKLRLKLGKEAAKVKEDLAIEKIAEQWIALRDRQIMMINH